MEKKIGAVVLATEQGLGYLAKSFFDHGLIDRVYVHPHTSRKTHREWYAGATVDKLEDLFSCESILFFEEAFYWKLIPQARERKIRTVFMVMYECTRNPMPYVPDMILNPSALDQKYYPQGIQVTVPVDAKWKLRTKAQVFVHNAGNGGLGGRNGTRELIEAMKYVKSPIKLIIRSQVPIQEHHDPRIEYRIGTFDDIWSEGDVFVFPEKFNGLSLPLQEAYASGMLVMAGDRFPINEWLPKEPLIPVSGYRKEKISVEFDSAIYSPEEIARNIDLWYNVDIESYSRMGKEWGERNSWSALKGEYKKLLT